MVSLVERGKSRLKASSAVGHHLIMPSLPCNTSYACAELFFHSTGKFVNNRNVFVPQIRRLEN